MTTTATLKASIRQYWNDQRLKWDPKNYGGTKRVWLKADPIFYNRIWTSDIMIR